MWELRFVAASDDGDHLVVRCADLDDEEFLLPVTDELRDAVAPPVRPTRPATADGEPLTPREIQARIRGGESPEELATAAGVPFAKVERFAGPVLSERAHVAAAARAARVPVARGAEDSTSLDDVVVARLERDGVAPEDVEWDAWRRDDGIWMLQVSYVADGLRHTAEWSWDPARHQLRPYGAAARSLSSGDTTPVEEPADRRVTSPDRRATPAGLRMVPSAVPAPVPVQDETGPALDSAPMESAFADTDAFGDTSLDGSRPADGATPPVPAASFDAASFDAVADGGTPTADGGAPDAPAEQPALPIAGEPADASNRPERRSRTERKGRLAARDHAEDDDGVTRRASVPSWDDILFGVRRQR